MKSFRIPLLSAAVILVIGLFIRLFVTTAPDWVHSLFYGIGFVLLIIGLFMRRREGAWRPHFTVPLILGALILIAVVIATLLTSVAQWILIAGYVLGVILIAIGAYVNVKRENQA